MRIVLFSLELGIFGEVLFLNGARHVPVRVRIGGRRIGLEDIAILRRT